MGWGGILGSIAQGMGTGIVKNVENGWKEEADQKEMDWQSGENAKSREQDILLKNMDFDQQVKIAGIELENAITLESKKAVIRAREIRTGKTPQEVKDAEQVIGMLQERQNLIRDQMKGTPPESPAYKALNDEILALDSKIAREANRPDNIALGKQNRTFGTFLEMNGGVLEDFNPVRVAGTASEIMKKVTPATKTSPDVLKPNYNNMTPQQRLDTTQQDISKAKHAESVIAMERQKELLKGKPNPYHGRAW